MSWNKLNDKGKTQALAELLGWHQEKRNYNLVPIGPVSGALWVDAKGESIVLVDAFKPLNDWASMGLVVEAMARRGHHVHIHGGKVRNEAWFDVGETSNKKGSSSWSLASKMPAAVAEAAWKALGGE